MKIFLSYSATDRRLASEIAATLSAGGYDVWFAEKDVLPGDNWHRKVADALEECEAMVVLVSPESVQTEAVRSEISYALASPNYAGRLIPVLVRPTPDMPWILRELQVIRAGRNRAQLVKRIIEQLESVAK